MRSAGAAIVPIKLQEGQKMDSKILRHVTGSGPVYIRMLKDLTGEVCMKEIIVL